jgi:ATP-dependent Clp protease ATP-binding subunit ClpA
VFERFTAEARQVVVLAQDEARKLKHNYIGTEHILLGLLREEKSLAAQALQALGITLQETRAHVLRIVGAGEEASPGQQVPFTPRAKKVLELSLREALSLGHNWIGPEHILLGLARENEGVAARILLDAGVEGETIRSEVVRILPPPGDPVPEATQRLTVHARPHPSSSEWLGPVSPALDRLAREIRHELHREPDVGDLLLVLASMPETLVGQALAEVGVDLDALQTAVERLRQTHLDERTEALEEIRRRLGLPTAPEADPPLD